MISLIVVMVAQLVNTYKITCVAYIKFLWDRAAWGQNLATASQGDTGDIWREPWLPAGVGMRSRDCCWPGALLNTLQHTGQLPIAQNYPAPKVSGVEFEKPCPRGCAGLRSQRPLHHLSPSALRSGGRFWA